MISRNSQNSVSVLLLSLIFFWLIPANGSAQFIDLTLEVDSKLSASSEQQLYFGEITPNSGKREINLGNVNMGVLTITALENQLLMVTMDKPTELHHRNSAISDVVPIDLFFRYGYSAQNYEESFPVTKNSEGIKVAPNPDPGPWNAVYLFIYGTIDVGNITDGIYANEIVLNIEYI